MQFPYEFFADEVREGFYISGNLKRCWAAQLEVLFEIDKVCKKYGIRWHIDCGSLLGAVRHRGYVPWDDDMDICMLREDFMKFFAVARDELPEGYVIMDMHNEEEDFAEYFGRITNSHRIRFDDEFLEKYHNCPYCAGIDVFPIDSVCPDKGEEKLWKEICKSVMHAAESKFADEDDKEALKEELEYIESVTETKFDMDKPIRKQLYELVEALYAMYNDPNSEEVALMPFWTAHDNHLYKRQWFEETIYLPFEGVMLPAPKQYDAVLKVEYGDYMRVFKGGGLHDYPFYKKQEHIIIDMLPSYPFVYEYKPEHLEKNKLPQKSSKVKSAEFLKLIKEIHKIVSKAIRSGEYQSCLQLLESCQQSAIQIGTEIEEQFYEGHSSVKILEEYCEILYQVAQLIEELAVNEEINEELFSIVESSIAEIENALSESLQQYVINRKEIVFMPFRSTHWDAMESLWEVACADPDADVYVVPTPYFERTISGELINMRYDGNDFPEYVPIVSCDEYDFVNRHPDKIYIQNPYDECNFTFSVAPDFYSRFLKKYTEELIYVPYFMMDVPTRANEKGWFTMEYFCQVPGLFHADKVILQSEEMKQAYVDRLTEFAGEETREIWENKIEGTGSPLVVADKKRKQAEREQLLSVVPDEWKNIIYKPDGSLKKLILFRTGVAYMSQYGDKYIDKLYRTLEVFKENKDNIAVIWRLDPELYELLVEDKELAAKLSGFVADYKSSEYGIIDDSRNISELVSMCDAYYGDSGNVARACTAEGKPVMLMSVDV